MMRTAEADLRKVLPNFSADRILGSNFVNAVLDLSKIEAGKLSLEVLPLDIDQIFDNILSMQQVRAEHKGISLFVESGLDRHDLQGDPTRLQPGRRAG